MIRDIKKEVITALNQLAHVSVIDDEAMVALAGIFSNEVDAWRAEIVSEINRQIAIDSRFGQLGGLACP